MIRNRSLPTDIVLPHIRYRDLEQAIPWRTSDFGVAEDYRCENPITNEG